MYSIWVKVIRSKVKLWRYKMSFLVKTKMCPNIKHRGVLKVGIRCLVRFMILKLKPGSESSWFKSECVHVLRLVFRGKCFSKYGTDKKVLLVSLMKLRRHISNRIRFFQSVPGSTWKESLTYFLFVNNKKGACFYFEEMTSKPELYHDFT